MAALVGGWVVAVAVDDLQAAALTAIDMFACDTAVEYPAAGAPTVTSATRTRSPAGGGCAGARAAGTLATGWRLPRPPLAPRRPAPGAGCGGCSRAPAGARSNATWPRATAR